MSNNNKVKTLSKQPKVTELTESDFAQVQVSGAGVNTERNTEHVNTERNTALN
jgi:hypothetical protein